MTRTAVEIAHLVGRGEATAESFVSQALEAAGADTSNAFVSLDERAMARAAEVDAAVAEGRVVGPLAGVPVAVKDLVDHEGRLTTAGSGFYRHAADQTAPALARLEQAGAVVIGRTGLHEFAFGFSSENPWFGPVTNPWDPTLSPGGSSGGSAAAVAAGIVPIAVGTDTGGSVRVPAALCGIAGLKVTHGSIPLTGIFPLVPSLDTVGPLAATIDDLDVAASVMAGAIPSDMAPGSLDGLRLVVPGRWMREAPLEPRVAEAFTRFLDAVSDQGAGVEELELAEVTHSHLIGAVIGPEVAEVHRAWREAGRPYGDDVGARIDAALAVTPAEAEEGARWRRVLTDALAGVTAGGTLVVTPTVAGLDKRIGVDDMGGHNYRRVLSWFSAPVNQSGAPALSLPLAGPGRTPSVQLIGSAGSETRLLGVGRALARSELARMGLWSSDNPVG